MKARGFAIPSMAQLIIVLGLVAALSATAWGFLAWHAEEHFARGQDAMKLEWEEANRLAEEKAEETQLAVELAIGELEKEKKAAEERARRADDRWKEASRDAHRNGEALTVCRAVVDRGPAGAVADQGAGVPAAGAALLTWRFVHLYDTAWTSLAAEPLPGAPQGAAGAAGAGAASPYNAGELLDVHGENARRCSEDRRELAKLIATIEAAATAFEKTRQGGR